MSSRAPTRWRRLASCRLLWTRKSRLTCGASGPRGNMTSWRATRLSKHQHRYNPQPGRDTVPAERFQSEAANEADERSHDDQRDEESHDKADGDVEPGIKTENAAVLPQIEHRGTEHGGDREIERKERAGLALHADQFSAQDGGARPRHSGNDRQHLEHPD